MIPVLAVLLAAQAHGAHGGPSRPPEELGRVVFPISCTAAAQQDFQRGMALMHSFWYEEAGEAFQQAARADRTCAMAHWGDAMSRLHAIWGYDSRAAVRAGRAAIERAAALDAKTDRERDYVTAAGAYFAGDDSLSHDTRMEAYEAAMERVYRRHPADDEAAMLYALALVGNAPATDTTFAQRRRAGAILEPIFARQPNHPGLAHYLIHAYDSPVLAERAVPAARRYAAIAPSVPHARHMPSHIFNTLGMWDDAIRSDSNALAALRDTAVTDILRGHRLHSLDYQQYAFLQEGRDAEAARATDEARAVLALMATRRPYYAATLPARLLLERGRWAEAARLDPGNAPVTQYARGLGAARSGDTALARAAVAELTRLEGGGEGGADCRATRPATRTRGAWRCRPGSLARRVTQQRPCATPRQPAR